MMVCLNHDVDSNRTMTLEPNSRHQVENNAVSEHTDMQQF